MRNITKQASDCFHAGKPLRLRNTEVAVFENGTVELFLHGRAIARRKGSRLWFSTAGYPSVTTKERLNGIGYKYEVRVSQQNHQWYWSAPWRTADAEEFDIRAYAWTLVHPGSYLEQLAQVKEDNDER